MIKLYEEFSGNAKVDREFIDTIRFGYSTAEINRAIDKNNSILQFFVNKGFADEIVKKAPANSSRETQQDFQIMQARMKAANLDDILFARVAEENLELVFADFFAAKDCSVSMLEIRKVIAEVDPINFYLKNRVQRPRPHQLAWYYQLKIYPLIHTDANTAAYPSGHALNSYALANYFGRKFPNLQSELRTLAQRIADSRVYCGIHYPSDSTASEKIVNIIFKNDLI